MRRFLLLAPVLVLTAMTLSACGPSGQTSTGTIRLSLPPPPGDLQACFNRLVPMPVGSTMSRQDIVALIAKLRRSEAAQSRCGRRLLAWYGTEAGGLR